jgi:uncharacterized protein (DUF1499 family)
MSSSAIEVPQGASRWSSRLALFSLLLIAVALLLHRVFALPTAVALNLVGVALAGALLAILLGLYASIDIWRKGTPGGARILVGIGLGLAILALPALATLAARNYPTLNDLTTDPADPPVFRTLAAARTGMANPPAYPGAAFAAVQKKAYPDLVPMVINRPPSETFDLVVDALKRLHMTVVAEEPPTPEEPVGRAEAVDRTLVLGFYDDIAVRVSGDETRTRVDLRSSSRYGRSDFGQNAQRLRDIMREIVARLEATVPAATPEDIARNKKTLKERKNAAPEKAGGRKSRDDAPPSARRAPER